MPSACRATSPLPKSNSSGVHAEAGATQESSSSSSSAGSRAVRAGSSSGSGAGAAAAHGGWGRRCDVPGSIAARRDGIHVREHCLMAECLMACAMLASDGACKCAQRAEDAHCCIASHSRRGGASSCRHSAQPSERESPVQNTFGCCAYYVRWVVLTRVRTCRCCSGCHVALMLARAPGWRVISYKCTRTVPCSRNYSLKHESVI